MSLRELRGGTIRPGDTDAKEQERSVGNSGDQAGLAESDVWYILGNRRRRTVISRLLEGESPVSLMELTRHVAADEYGVCAADVSPNQYKRVYSALSQCHLPQLADSDVIEFDEAAKTVALGDAASDVEPYLEAGRGSDSARLELTVAVIVASLVAFGALGVGPLGAIPVRWWAGLTVFSLVGTGLFQLYK